MLRTDTVHRDECLINLQNQQCIFTLGRRGTGKSYVDETLVTTFYEYGFTILDLWASDNFENAFWCIAKEGEKKRFPVTILAPESLIFNQSQLDIFNGKIISREEWYKKYPLEGYPIENPPARKESKEWIKIVKLPIPTAKIDSEQNQTIAKIIENVILDCRENRRILVFNPSAYRNESHMFRTLELIIRNLSLISEKHFVKLNPEQVGKTSRDQMTRQEKSWHKMCVLIREMGELAPAKLKGDHTGESTRVKKAILQFIRKARHYRIWVVSDWQKASDVEDAIRQQGDIWILKKYTKRLGGDEWKWFFDYISNKRRQIFESKGYGSLVRRYADSFYPNIDQLSEKYMYVVYGNDRVYLKKVESLKHHHKEPYDSFQKITGITFDHDLSQIQKGVIEDAKSSSRPDEQSLHNAVYVMRHPKKGRKMSWDEIIQKLKQMQENGEIIWNKPFGEMKKETLGKWFLRASIRYEKAS